ncbi:beta-1,3-glucanase family protein [Hymenobacter sp. 15J16-1T3B]|uniref:beta-1,3-glucanase family protein n=1 Tax=Hymenobacter sp. 15J16-1T3B TaxID=2886941 RepID=UPI001D118AF3|nr:beta-1,3-glucanase family protein [Hymenobacter sp. 15J16-1T3B]MCC3156576.1 beta-1,3-glucanase family protein [Hymenobacter sp. 15J16-1T3B]
MKKTTLLWSALTVLLTALLGPLGAWAQGSIPFTIANNSPFPDTDLYVAIVGIDGAGNHVWINAANSQVLPMSSSYNTVTGPTISGNTGPGGNSKYAACFTRLSSIPNKTFTLPYIAGCRVFISKGQQLYLYFFGASGAPSGYAAPNPQNASDPNTGIMYEFIELTNNNTGFYGNTTRVDAFRYPMGLELWGNGYQKRTGELKTAADIVAAYKANVPTEFQGTVNNVTGEITFPSKTAAFQDGSNGTTAGPYGQYFKSYIDAIWNKYKSTDLIFYAGNAGVFKGRVDANDRLVVVGQSGAFAGRTGIINGRPTTQMAFEGKGLLDNRVGDGDCDLVVQAQMTAAINRHVVDVTTATPGQQNWYDATRYYQAAPANYYARFWHLPGISVDNLSYGFAYDDVNDQSATLHTPQPTKVVATFGGYAGQSPPATGVATVYKDCNYLGTAVSLPVGDYTLAALQSRGILNDDISSLKVNSGYEVVLYENDNYSGGSLTVGSAGNGCLVNNPLGTGNWNDKATSLRVRAASAAFSVTLQAEAANVNNGMTVETCSDTGGGQDMGYVDAGDYLVWNGITFPTTGSYLIEYRVASPSGGTISSDLNAGAIPFGNSTIPATGGWQTWTTVSKTVTVNAGTYNVGIFAQTGGWNINWVRISKSGSARAAAPADLQAATLYPNPAVDQLTLRTEAPLAGAPYRILNHYGQPVASGLLPAGGTVSVAKLPAGVYTLVVSGADGQLLTRRFMK